MHGAFFINSIEKHVEFLYMAKVSYAKKNSYIKDAQCYWS